MENFDGILKFMPSGALRQSLARGLESVSGAEEIRLRAERPLSVFADGKALYIGREGGICAPREALAVSRQAVSAVFKSLCENSVYAYTDEIRRGFVTIRGGHRAGFTGRAIRGRDGRIESFRDISSINIRISREIVGAAAPFIGGIVQGDRIKSALVISPPASYQTRALRWEYRTTAAR